MESVSSSNLPPLILSAAKGDFQEVERLLQSSSALVTTNAGNTALFFAAKVGCIKSVEKLLQADSALINTRNSNGDTGM